VIIGIGIDLAEISRIRQLVEKYGHYFLDRVFTDREKAYCLGKADPYPSFAARFAAKEALFKALGRGWPGIPFTDVQVEQDDTGKPYLRLTGKASALADASAETQAHLSLTHEKDYAAAFVIVESAR
jgi:holo-[acyl-carrier protein] synthase